MDFTDRLRAQHPDLSRASPMGPHGTLRSVLDGHYHEDLVEVTWTFIPSCPDITQRGDSFCMRVSYSSKSFTHITTTWFSQTTYKTCPCASNMSHRELQIAQCHCARALFYSIATIKCLQITRALCGNASGSTRSVHVEEVPTFRKIRSFICV